MAERGSVLMLMPAAVLVVVVLGALTVDHAAVFLAERQLADAAAAAANDAATAAIDHDRFYAEGVIELDTGRARAVVEEAVRARAASWLAPVEVVRVDVVAGRPVITVELAARVEHLFAAAIPGARRTTAVQATATATAVRR